MPTRATYVRRRVVALVVVAAVAAVLLVASSGGGGKSRRDAGDARARQGQPAPAPSADDRQAAANLSVVQRAGTTIVMRFAGTIAPPYVLTALREDRAAGVILFADNLATSAQLRALTRALHRANPRALVMVDQEGGAIRIVKSVGPRAGQAERTVGDAEPVARGAGAGLRRLGIDVALAPVADVVRPGTALAERGFRGPVDRLVAASVKGFLAGGVLPTAKHFPGLGDARTNTDFATARVGTPVSELDARDLPPFRAAISAGVPLVMASHALYPALDRAHIASQSPAILTGLLRHRLGFAGAIITDSLEAKAVTRRTSTPVAAVRSMAAGADLLLTTGRGSYLRVLRALKARVEADPALAARVAAADARVAALQDRAMRARR